ncbi:putative F-box protein At1g67623 [Arachis stenosperma]|uniref:putative F-box protein At1g67623 n=1 Tax=Arachis stenosperma TaxID=217475 RepID=UPI0025ACC00F|nr:putative F-box protein At1g67623 [Arachis stenosperma]
MAGSSKINRKKGNVPAEHECQLNLLPRDIWVRIAAKVASNSIHDLFNMQASCKVFLDAASSEAVYQHATMRVIALVSFLFYLDRPKRRFLDRCVEAGNADAILRLGLIEYFWIACRGIRMELLARASTEGSVEAGYLFAMLLLCDHEDEEKVQRGVEMLEFIRTSGKVERCREFFANIFWERWVDERPSDPGHAVACWSTSCFTRGTMADVNDVSRVSCVHRLADYEVRVFLEMFRF